MVDGKYHGSNILDAWKTKLLIIAISAKGTLHGVNRTNQKKKKLRIMLFL